MAVAPVKPRLSREEYLAWERASDTKHELRAGEIVAMSGASREHNLITLNVGTLLNNQLRDRPCEVYNADMRVAVEVIGDYTYPDVVVVCGEPRFEDDTFDILTNPTVLVEVLSPSTEDYDRGNKFAAYRQIASLQDYVLVAQHRASVEHYARRGEQEWLLALLSGRESVLRLDSLGCELPLAEIYRKVPLS
jgi:Uma2 family endonuclease